MNEIVKMNILKLRNILTITIKSNWKYMRERNIMTIISLQI